MVRTMLGVKRNSRNGVMTVSLVCVCEQCKRFMSSEEELNSLSWGFYK